MNNALFSFSLSLCTDEFVSDCRVGANQAERAGAVGSFDLFCAQRRFPSFTSAEFLL